ncbi:sulfurtransferase [Variovorax dokdonensis]|uniref:tRNA uridine(34) hydroxylase n=1 Tax=Variovorax dokdonensis TaxID=344883 RepID=A0ABT7ND32_9BURK|nr:sulfurtransferase [Variovorax dokdonensis]
MSEILNIAAYKFVAIGDGPALRDHLLAHARTLELRGTVLISPEGINMFLAGTATAVEDFLALLRADARFSDLVAKKSWSATQPFRRMLVKCKREIIRMDHPAIQPASGRAPGVEPATLRRWLDQGHDDEGKPVALLDTRNAFEVDYGTFEGAIDWRISKFTEFPKAVAEHREQLAGKTVVSFCTGGIRCEKANLLMHEMGLDNTLQLEGGILRYFEEVGGAHYRGDCFVFDGREALAPDLSARRQDVSARAPEDPDLGVKRPMAAPAS